MKEDFRFGVRTTMSKHAFVNAEHEPRPVDPIQAAFGAAIGEVMAMLPDSIARRVAVNEIMQAHERTKAALVRRVLN